VSSVGELLAEVGTREGGADQLRWLAGGKSDHGEDGDPAAKFTFTDERNGVANAVNFRAEAEERGI